MKPTDLTATPMAIDKRLVTNVLVLFLLAEALLFVAIFVFNEALITFGVIAAAVGTFVVFNKPEIGVLVSVGMVVSAVSATYMGGAFKIIVLYTLICLVAAWLHRDQAPVSDSINKMVWPFTIWVLISLSYVKSYPLASESLVEYFGSLVLFLLVSNLIREHATMRRLFWVIVLAGGYIAGVNLYRLFDDPLAFAQRLGWPFEDPNSLALALVSVVPFAYALVRSERSKVLRILALLSGLLLVAATIPTLSRGGILALTLVLAYILFKERKQKVVVYSMAALALVGLFLLYTKLDFAVDILSKRFGGVDRSIVQRYRLFTGGIAMFLDHPFLGVGLGNFLLYSTGYTNLIQSFYAHNMFIHVAAELGIIGIALFIGIVVTAFRRLHYIEALATQKNHTLTLFQSRGILISLMGLVICAMFLSQHFNKILWILFGMSVAMTQIAKREGLLPSQDV